MEETLLKQSTQTHATMDDVFPCPISKPLLDEIKEADKVEPVLYTPLWEKESIIFHYK